MSFIQHSKKLFHNSYTYIYKYIITYVFFSPFILLSRLKEKFWSLFENNYMKLLKGNRKKSVYKDSF